MNITEKKMKRSISMRMILPGKKKKIKQPCYVDNKSNRLLITVNVVGSSGPLRFVVNHNDKVSTVIDSSLKLYARGGRLPILGSDFDNFMLFSSDAGSVEELHWSEEIGSCGGRNFVLCKMKKNNKVGEEAAGRSRMMRRQHSGRWKACILCLAQ